MPTEDTPSSPSGPVSAAQVAARAGVSRSAVSRTFTAGASVSRRTREKVLQAAAELDYHVNHMARGILRDESRPVCLLGSNLDTPFLAQQVEALTRALQAAGRVAMVINTAADHAEEALRLSLGYRASASIVLSGSPPAALVASCLAAGQRVILVNRDDVAEGALHLRIDHAAAMQEAAALLAGARRVALVTSASGTASLRAREEAFVAALAAAGQACLTWRAGPTAYETGLAAARALLGAPEPPDAIFCTTDLLALGVIDAARHDFGLSLPDALRVVGFDDIPQAGWRGYGLTTFAQPHAAMAAAIVAALKGTLASPCLLPAELVRRQTA